MLSKNDAATLPAYVLTLMLDWLRWTASATVCICGLTTRQNSQYRIWSTVLKAYPAGYFAVTGQILHGVITTKASCGLKVILQAVEVVPPFPSFGNTLINSKHQVSRKTAPYIPLKVGVYGIPDKNSVGFEFNRWDRGPSHILTHIFSGRTVVPAALRSTYFQVGPRSTATL